MNLYLTKSGRLRRHDNTLRFEKTALPPEETPPDQEEEALDEPPGRTIPVTVPEGASAKDIAMLLEDEGLVEDWKLFYFQILCSKYANTMQPGEYVLSTAMKPRELMAVMSGEEVEFSWDQQEES